MDVRILKNDDEIFILEPLGDLNLRTSNHIKELAVKLMGKKIGGMIIDLKNVTILRSEGIGALINISSTLKKLGCGLAITNASDEVRKVMDISRLSAYLPIAATLKDAVKRIRAAN